VLPSDEVTLAERLHAADYAQMGFTANFRLDLAHGVPQGFDFWKEDMAEPKPRLERIVYGVPGAAFGALDYVDALWTWRRTWWQRLRVLGPPRHLYLQFMEPHGPYMPPADVAERIAGPPPPGTNAEIANDRMLSGGFDGLSPAEVRYLEGLYDAEVATLDDGLRRLFDQLRQRGLLNHTVVVITSDHGEQLG